MAMTDLKIQSQKCSQAQNSKSKQILFASKLVTSKILNVRKQESIA